MSGCSQPARACLLLALCLPAAGFASPQETGAQTPAAASPADPERDPVFPDVNEANLGELTVRWWQWAMALPVEPYLDPDGSLCPLGHMGHVWFLAGTDGVRDDIVRTCEVPLGVPLLLPVVNRYAARPFAAPRLGDTVPECEQLQAQAAMPPDGLVRAKVTLDGVELGPVTAHRVPSAGCFNPYPWLPEPEGKPAPLAASDGYWLLLDPLPPGRHVLDVDAHYRREGFEIVQRFRYVLQAGGGGHLVMH